MNNQKILRNIFEHEEDYYKPVKADKFKSNKFSECERN